MFSGRTEAVPEHRNKRCTWERDQRRTVEVAGPVASPGGGAGTGGGGTLGINKESVEKA